MDKSHRFTMLENQVLEPRNLEVLERVKGSSTPNLRTNKYPTFNYINYLAYISVF